MMPPAADENVFNERLPNNLSTPGISTSISAGSDKSPSLSKPTACEDRKQRQKQKTNTNKQRNRKKNCSNFHANARKINHRLNVWRKAVAMTRTTEARRTDWQATQSDRSNYSTRSTLHHMCMDAASVLILFTKPHVIVFGSDDGVHIEPANAVTSSSRNFSRPTCAASAPVQSEQKIKLNVDMY